MSENSEKNLQEMFDGDLSVDDEQLNSIAEDDSIRFKRRYSERPTQSTAALQPKAKTRQPEQTQPPAAKQNKQSQQRKTACQRTHIPSKERSSRKKPF